MDIIDVIKARRSVGKVKPDAVDEKTIKQLLDSAIWAPNHFLTEPWKFFVLTEDGRKPLGRTLAEIAKEKIENPNTEENQAKLKKQEEKAFRAPVIIAVAAVPSDNPKVEKIEEFGAVYAATQNLLLTAHALGLGAMWRTGKACYHPKMKQLFGLSNESSILGFIYLGYSAMPERKGRRTPVEEKTVWIHTDQMYAD